MLTPKEHFHGSDLEKIEAIYGIKKEEITSFSANVNPLGISPKLKAELANKIDAITGYPDREYTSLRKCIAAYVHADMEHVVVGNGSTELISLFIQITHPKKALIIGPTYSEYEREISLGGGSSQYYRLEETDDFHLNVEDLKKELTSEFDLLVICNPNNPTSSAIPLSDMRKILDICKLRGILCMVDETYVEFAEDMEQITAISLASYYNNIIILRGISKFFAAPGLRLGYAVCGNMDMLKLLNQRKNPWTINTLAAIAGEIMFTDEEYISQTKALIKQERDRIYEMLSSCYNVRVYPPVANFVLVKILKENITASDLFDAAIRKGLMIRDCSTFPFLDQKFIRFCFMSPEKNTELMNLLLELLK
ncbi:aminotransferase class I/II-fold pyridoxal phosphate-dependent enzyme [Anaerocolumna sedimenticola]|uniref:Aminotransferase n=1 Tax=Anaerocolumna sedimenticola TaxID=2696063 RepID=A0A6P1TE87_9FIRM|nr:threonine-phosphate decarboxylase [Anaerocolumna sedimenticola]QHQ59550.1 aminotransferase class I/II-fold pyridoxal phosphate-dependent enzyme [Anaerocolumna sedimenticola]